MSDLYLSRMRDWLLGSPPAEWALGSVRSLLIGALKQGPIPRHVAFEMDGNRRYAKNHQIEAVEGHSLGFEALARILDVCYKCGVEVVTVYAFSIENFNRPRYEVEGLMQLAKLKLEQLAQHGEILDRYSASVRILGQRDLIPPDVLKYTDKLIASTERNTKAILNICFSYTSREEMTTAVRKTVEQFSTSPRPHRTTFSQRRITQKILSRQGAISETPTPPDQDSPASKALDDADDSGSSSTSTLFHPKAKSEGLTESIAIYPNAENITAETLDSHMYTGGCPPLDMFVRTSGVERLSDFMLWQCHQATHVFFLKCFWPDFDLWHFLPVLLEWQWRMKQKERDEKPRRGVTQA